MSKPSYTYMMTPVSRQVSVQVVANGQIGAKHLRHLIRMLKLDLEIHEEEEAKPPFVGVPAEEGLHL